MADQLIKNKDIIPNGDYCYDIIEIKKMSDKEAECEITYCKFVERSDVCLLDDQCKTCGENNE